jgi:NADH:ubiquinone oxidoreductase subunit 4 (subunit M)
LSKIIALNFSAFPFLIFVVLWGGFKKSIGSFQFVTKILWVPVLNLNVTLGIDGISLFFLLLTTLLIPLCILISWNSVQFNLKEYLIAFLAIEFFLIGVFCVLDVLMFYIFFESILIPMFLVIGVWGSRERKIWASYYFFLYTLFGSVLMLISILYIYNQVGTTDYEILLTFAFSDLEQKLLWFTFFPSIRIKSTYDACYFMVA